MRIEFQMQKVRRWLATLIIGMTLFAHLAGATDPQEVLQQLFLAPSDPPLTLCSSMLNPNHVGGVTAENRQGYVYWRTLENIRKELGGPIDDHLKRTMDGDPAKTRYVMLAGGGIGLYGIEIARMGFRVASVDLDPAFLQLDTQLDTARGKPAENFFRVVQTAQGAYGIFCNIRLEALEAVGKFYGTPLEPLQQFYTREIKSNHNPYTVLLKYVEQNRAKIDGLAHFLKYSEIGFVHRRNTAQNFLSRGTENNLVAIFDPFAAYRYSTGKAKLLAQYLKALAPNGKAFIGRGADEFRDLARGSRDLIEHLAEMFPKTVFITETGKGFYLQKEDAEEAEDAIHYLEDLEVLKTETEVFANGVTHPVEIYSFPIRFR